MFLFCISSRITCDNIPTIVWFVPFLNGRNAIVHCSISSVGQLLPSKNASLLHPKCEPVLMTEN